MPYLLDLSLTLETPLRGLPGPLLHGYIYHALKRVDSSLSHQIHSYNLSPFSVQILELTQPLKVRLVLLEEGLSSMFLEAFKVGSSSAEGTALTGFVSALSLNARPYASLLEAQSSRHAWLCKSCCCVKGGLNAARIWAGLARRWQVFSPYPVEGNYGRAIKEGVRVLKDNTRPCNVRLSKRSLKGFTGEALFTVDAPPEDALFLNALGEFAHYAGIGSATAYGYGNVVSQPQPLSF